MKRKNGAAVTSWELSDELWDAARHFIPQRKRPEGKTYKRKSGAGRKPKESRRVLEAIFYVLRTGIQWKALPAEYGSSSSAHRYFSEWAQAGFFQRLWQEGLIAENLLKSLGWEWHSADGRMVKVPLARESTGRITRITGQYRDSACQPEVSE